MMRQEVNCFCAYLNNSSVFVLISLTEKIGHYQQLHIQLLHD